MSLSDPVFSHEWRSPDAPVPQRVGRFPVLERVPDAGQGSQGTVYRGQDPDTGASVAIKVLGDPLASFEGSVLASLVGESALQELRREARTLGGLRHPHIVPLVEVGEDPVQGAYLVTAWMPGGSLRARLDRAGKLPLGQAVGVCRDILSGLTAAHAAGLLHLDVKPENILFDAEEHARLTDFGIAATMGEVTGAQAGRGTPGYMAPEQIDPQRWAEVGPATDLFAVGVVHYEMLSGHRPQGDLQDALLEAPEPSRGLLARALVPRPSDRFPSADAMLQALPDTR